MRLAYCNLTWPRKGIRYLFQGVATFFQGRLPLSLLSCLYSLSYGRISFHSDKPIMYDMGRKLRGKDYVGCLIQILQIVTGIIAIIVFVRQCSGG